MRRHETLLRARGKRHRGAAPRAALSGGHAARGQPEGLSAHAGVSARMDRLLRLRRKLASAAATGESRDVKRLAVRLLDRGRRSMEEMLRIVVRLLELGMDEAAAVGCRRGRGHRRRPRPPGRHRRAPAHPPAAREKESTRPDAHRPVGIGQHHAAALLRDGLPRCETLLRSCAAATPP